VYSTAVSGSYSPLHKLTEAGRSINDLDEIHIQKLDGFCIAPLGYFRASKLAYFGFFTVETLGLIQQMDEKINWEDAVTYRRKRPDVAAFKYIRRFVDNTMTGEGTLTFLKA